MNLSCHPETLKSEPNLRFIGLRYPEIWPITSENYRAFLLCRFLSMWDRDDIYSECLRLSHILLNENTPVRTEEVFWLGEPWFSMMCSIVHLLNTLSCGKYSCEWLEVLLFICYKTVIFVIPSSSSITHCGPQNECQPGNYDILIHVFRSLIEWNISQHTSYR